jgi:hypothetical protein
MHSTHDQHVKTNVARTHVACQTTVSRAAVLGLNGKWHSVLDVIGDED